MKSQRKNLLYFTLPGMEVYLASCFFESLTDRPRRLHLHPCYELVCIDGGKGGMRFYIHPPLTEHLAADASPEQICSLLFSFLPEKSNDICQALRVEESTEIFDCFDGAARIRSLKALVLDDVRPGTHEQIEAELRLLFVSMARTIAPDATRQVTPHQTLDEERMARLEDYFNIQLKDPNCSKQQLAAELGVCERQLTRILEETYRSNFSTLLLQSRMSLAEAMRKQGEKSIDEIAASVGYTSINTFRRAYRAFFGKPFISDTK